MGTRILRERFNPILDVFEENGVRFALEVHPTEIAFDIVSAQRALAAVKGSGRRSGLILIRRILFTRGWITCSSSASSASGFFMCT